MVDSPRALLRRLEDLVTTAPGGRPSVGCVYAGALRNLVVAVDRAVDGFADPQQPRATTAFLVRRFLAAESAHRRGRPDDVPLPWRTALSVDPARPVLRLLLVTANAGLNDDLPRALLEVPGWDGAGSRADHDAWTELMADAFADAACPPGGNALERAVARRERPLVRRALGEAGTQAWRNAQDLLRHRTAEDRPDRPVDSVGTGGSVSTGGSAGTGGFEARSRLLATLTTGQVGELLTRHRFPLPRWSELLVVRL